MTAAVALSRLLPLLGLQMQMLNPWRLVQHQIEVKRAPCRPAGTVCNRILASAAPQLGWQSFKPPGA
jgi:hypothetical protein